MAAYQVLARKYRPQSFDEVLGQPAIVTTLKNAIKMVHEASFFGFLLCGPPPIQHKNQDSSGVH